MRGTRAEPIADRGFRSVDAKIDVGIESGKGTVAMTCRNDLNRQQFASRVAILAIAATALSVWMSASDPPSRITVNASKRGEAAPNAVAQSVDCPTPARPGEILWTHPVDGTITGAPAIGADGTVYFGTDTGKLYAIGCRDKLRWVFDYATQPGGSQVQAFEGAPAIGDDGTIFIGDDVVEPNFAFAIRPDGTLRWVHRGGLGSQMDVSPALDADGRVYFGSQGSSRAVSSGSLLVLDDSGKLRPGFPIFGIGPVTSSPAVLRGDRVVFISSVSEQFNPRPGLPTLTPFHPPGETPTPPPTRTVRVTPSIEPARRTPTPSPALVDTVHLPLLANGALPASSVRPQPIPQLDQSLPDAPNQSSVRLPGQLFTIRGGQAEGMTIDDIAPGTMSSLAAVGEVLVFQISGEPREAGGTLPPRLVAMALDPEGSPRLLWEHFTRGIIPKAPVLGPLDPATGRMELVYLDDSGTLVSLDVPGTATAQGEPRFNWAQTVSVSDATGAPALGDSGHVYVATGDRVTAYSRADGSEAWSVTLNDPDAMPGSDLASSSVSLGANGVLYVGSFAGRLYAISTESRGLDPAAAWPSFRHDSRNTGRAGP
jgi:outer membrane protein assembly factor BamB